MKKLACLLAVVLILFGTTACDEEEKNTSPTSVTQQSTSTEQKTTTTDEKQIYTSSDEATTTASDTTTTETAPLNETTTTASFGTMTHTTTTATTVSTKTPTTSVVSATKPSTTTTKRTITTTTSATTTTTTKPGPVVKWSVKDAIVPDTLIKSVNGKTTSYLLDLSDLPQPYYNAEDDYGEFNYMTISVVGNEEWAFYTLEYGFVQRHGYNAAQVHTGGVYKIKADGTNQTYLGSLFGNYDKLRVNTFVDVIGGELYYLVETGERAVGIPEQCFLYKVKITDSLSDLPAEGTRLAELQNADLSMLTKNAYIDGEWLYFENEDYEIEDLTHWYKIKLDGSEEQAISNPT